MKTLRTKKAIKEWILNSLTEGSDWRFSMRYENMNHSIQNRENDYYIYSWGQGWSDQGLNEYSIDELVDFLYARRADFWNGYWSDYSWKFINWGCVTIQVTQLFACYIVFVACFFLCLFARLTDINFTKINCL